MIPVVSEAVFVGVLVLCRVGSCMMLLPGFGRQRIPMQFRALLAVAISLTLLPMLVALYGFGFAFASLVLLMKDANTLVDVSNFLVSMLSGSQFPVSVLPRLLLPLSLAIPLTYGFDSVRAHLLGTTTLLPLRYELAILVLFMCVMVPLGSLIFMRVEHRCRTLGTLSQH